MIEAYAAMFVSLHVYLHSAHFVCVSDVSLGVFLLLQSSTIPSMLGRSLYTSWTRTWSPVNLDGLVLWSSMHFLNCPLLMMSPVASPCQPPGKVCGEKMANPHIIPQTPGSSVPTNFLESIRGRRPSSVKDMILHLSSLPSSQHRMSSEDPVRGGYACGAKELLLVHTPGVLASCHQQAAPHPASSSGG